MSSKNTIVGSCRVHNKAVFSNGEQIFESANPQGVAVDLLTEMYRQFGFVYPKFHKMDSLSKLGWLTAEILVTRLQEWNNSSREETGVILANAHSSLDTDLRYFATTKTQPSPALFVYTLPNIVIGEICIRHKFMGENAFFIQEKFDMNFLEYYVNDLMNNDILRTCICGWVDLIGDTYDSMLLWVEKDSKNSGVPFTVENINKIYQ